MKRIRPRRFSAPIVRLAALAGVLVTAALAGCAPQPFAEDSLAKQSATAVRAASVPGEPKEFVQSQRPQSLEYLPVGVTPPQRPVRPRDAGAAAALEAELDAQRKQSRTFATRPQPKATYDGSVPPRPTPPPKELIPR